MGIRYGNRGERPLKVGLAGLGTIGIVVARALDKGIHGLELIGVTVRDAEKAARNMKDFRNPAPIISAQELAETSDIIVECVIHQKRI